MLYWLWAYRLEAMASQFGNSNRPSWNIGSVDHAVPRKPPSQYLDEHDIEKVLILY